MNDPNEPLNDDLIDELLAPLRAVKLPDEVRSANRAAIHRALAQRTRPAWWRRSISVPVPLAIAASIALVVTAAASLWPAAESDARRPRQISVVETDAVTSGWSITRSYILSIESLAEMQNSFRPVVTEERNDT